MIFKKMKETGYGKNINSKKDFIPMGEFKNEIIEKVFEFSWGMSFGQVGEHRDHRSGGSKKRKNGEIFANTFQGKLSEFAVYDQMYSEFKDGLNEPDLEQYGLGQWDNSDFEINGKKMSVKSTKSFGNLLLLETKDWNSNGQYKPNLSKKQSDYDVFILVRINTYCEDLLKRMRALYSDKVEKQLLLDNIKNEVWKYDIPGFITNEDLKYIIRNEFVIKKGEMLNGNIPMDAENYYVQAGDMRNIKYVFEIMK